MNKYFCMAALAVGMTVVGCSKKSDSGGSSTAAVQVPAAAMTEAKTIFSTRCQSCHGATGEGDGPAAAALNPKPRKYSDGAWQKTVTDQQIADAIVKGGPAVGKSAMMPPNPDLASKTDVVNGLVQIVRSFAK